MINGYTFQWQVVTDHLPALLLGAWYDVWVSIVGFILACGLGLLLALCRLSGARVLAWPALTYVQIVRAIPPYVLLLWFHFGVSRLLGVAFTPLQSIVVVLMISGASYAAEIFRSGIAAIDLGQIEAGRSLGLKRFSIYIDIVLPQALRIVIAPLGNVMVGLLKSATLMGVIAVPDLLHVAQGLNVNYFAPFEAFTAVLAIFVTLVFILALLILAIERAAAHP